MKYVAPTFEELLNNPIVIQALEKAWSDSMPESEESRHEEGGWVYKNNLTGEIFVERASAGIQTAIDLSEPPIHEDCFVVGKFHTHPNPTSEGWEPGPSKSDKRVDAIHGVPDLIKADSGVYASGPNKRRGGLSGFPGYPM